MAILDSSMGDFSGSIGNITYRRRNGKIVAYRKPSKHKKNNSPEVKRNNGVFALKNWIASGINKIHIYQSIWKDAPVKGDNVISKVVSANTGRVTKDFDFSGAMLIPDDNPFQIEVIDASTEQKEHSFYFHFTIKCLKDCGTVQFDRTTISAQGLFCNEEKLTPIRKKYFFAPLLPDMKPLNFTDDLQFTLMLKGGDYLTSRDYFKHSLLLNLITYNSNLKPCESSQNIFIPLAAET